MSDTENKPDPAAEQAAALAAADAAENKAKEEFKDKSEKSPVDKGQEQAEDKSEDTNENTGEEGKVDSEDLDEETWGSTGDEVGDSVLLVLQNSGMETETAKALLFDAVQAGDPTQIDQATLIEKVGKHKATLIMAGVESYIGKQKALVADVTATVHATAGDKDSWDKVAKWANQKVPQEKRNELSAMLNAGGEQAKFAAQQFVNLYNADEANTSVGADTRVNGDAKAHTTGRAINSRTYFEELQKAQKTRASKAVIAEIQAARERGRKSGL